MMDLGSWNALFLIFIRKPMILGRDIAWGYLLPFNIYAASYGGVNINKGRKVIKENIK